MAKLLIYGFKNTQNKKYHTMRKGMNNVVLSYASFCVGSLGPFGRCVSVIKLVPKETYSSLQVAMVIYNPPPTMFGI